VLIKIQYFSLLRDLKGPDSIEMADGRTVGDLLRTLFDLVPGLSVWNKHLLIAAGIDWVPHEYILRPDDLISLMPPVQGG
jgi:molybdopterin converting factor small subunit